MVFKSVVVPALDPLGDLPVDEEEVPLLEGGESTVDGALAEPVLSLRLVDAVPGRLLSLTLLLVVAFVESIVEVSRLLLFLFTSVRGDSFLLLFKIAGVDFGENVDTGEEAKVEAVEEYCVLVVVSDCDWDLSPINNRRWIKFQFCSSNTKITDKAKAEKYISTFGISYGP